MNERRSPAAASDYLEGYVNPDLAPPDVIHPNAKKRRRRVLLWVVGVVAAICIALGVAAQIALDRAGPQLRSRVVETLATRFDSRVELGAFHVSVVHGFRVEGDDLRLYPHRFLTNQPLIAIAKFYFHVNWLGILNSPMHVGLVSVEGMTIQIPPKEQRLPSAPPPEANLALQPNPPLIPGAVRSATTEKYRGISIVVDQVLIQNARLIIGTSKPGNLPLDFELSRIVLHSIGPGKPMKFEATLVNARPRGNIQSSGYFGPFDAHHPGESPVSGDYVFTHADLSDFKGIGGILSSTGKYQGLLNRLVVDGKADVPDFRLSTGNHPMALHTVFHAVVDGTDGDTYLQPVDAQLGRSRFTVSGSVVRVKGADGHPHGHNITMDVTMGHARIEDFLNLAVRTQPPVMDGNLSMTARLFLPPGEGPVPQRIELQGKFDVNGTYFSSDKIQKKINELSRIGEGHPHDPDLRVSSPQPEANVPSEISGDFSLAAGRMNFSAIDFRVPGANIDLTGLYTLDGSQFDFHGHAKLHAHPSQMTTGWKSLLLKMADPFFAKQGYGTVVPIQVSGTKSEPHFGLDFGHSEQGPSPKKAH